MEVTKIVAPSVYHMFSLYLVYLLFWFVELRPYFGFVDMILVLVLPVPGNCLLLLKFYGIFHNPRSSTVKYALLGVRTFKRYCSVLRMILS